MRGLRRLALATDLVALATIMLGSWTRINGAGLTCPDWPLCHGRVLPTGGDGTIFEWLHRLLAFSITPLVLALLLTAWQRRSRSPFILPAMGFITALFLTQVVLGAATVHLGNSPVSVVAHWGTAMAFVAAVAALAIFAAARDDDERISADASRSALAIGGFLAVTSVIAFVTMCIGAYVSSSGAGLACLSIPGCAGNVVVYTEGQFVQMLHRIAAGATLIAAAGSFAVVWARPLGARVRAATTAGLALVCVQVLLGLLNVALRLPTDLREAHAVNAALAFLSFVIATAFAVIEARPAARSREALVRR